VEFEDTLCNDYLKFQNLKPEKTKNKISISKVYYCDKSNQKLAYLFFLSSKEFTTCVLESQMLNEAKFYEYENTEISIIELQFKENKWIFKNLTYNLDDEKFYASYKISYGIDSKKHLELFSLLI
jgi:hypothetical protein